MMNTQELIATHGPREAMDYDVVVVGAGNTAMDAARAAAKPKAATDDLETIDLDKEDK